MRHTLATILISATTGLGAVAACSSNEAATGSGGSAGMAGTGGSAAAAGTGGSAGASGAGGSAGVPQAKSNVPRDTVPSVPTSNAQALADGNATFALELYQQLAADSDNLFFSPHSVSVALAMAYAGAKSTTADEMAATLHFTLPQDELHAAMNALALALDQRNAAADPANGKGFRLNVANALWGEQTTTFKSTYLDTLAKNYGAGVYLVDFINDSSGAVVQINDWVSQATEDKIPQLLEPGDANSATRLVLTNAIYFNASWSTPFSPSATASGTFHAPGKDVTVPMMYGVATVRYAETADWQTIELPYEGKQVGMTLVLPAAGKLSTVEAGLSLAWLQGLDAAEASVPVSITMPKFSFKSRKKLGATLQALGMKVPFSAQADFSGITSGPLQIGSVLHEAFIAVDEEGTEAAAATAVVFDGGGVPQQPQEFTLDRPFVFFIRDYPTQAILFAGRVLDPS